ncbi:MAG: dihydroorotate dehydrogenase [Hyphomicrobiaceae bacterium]|jgi:dihydroorotate dehydrogenase
MLTKLAGLARPMLLLMEPERAHDVTLRSLESGMFGWSGKPDDARLGVDIWAGHVPNPIGIAAGFDKNGRVPDTMIRVGFGFSEIGTITPLPQVGNPKPRVFRLIRDRALINRLGFNNAGHMRVKAGLKRRDKEGWMGVNVGANKDTEDRTADYVLGLETFYDDANYFMVNISSPNTPGLRDLQAPAALDELLGRVMAARQKLIDSGKPLIPIAVKIAPDVAVEDLPAICERLEAHNVDAIAVSNTTLARPAHIDRIVRNEAGGLSGRPLFERSTIMLAKVYELTGGRIPLIGIGGIDSGETALQKIEAGATLIQLYTALVYEGPSLIERIKDHLIDAVDTAGAASIQEFVGRTAKDWAAREITD